jgi:hypothetical protein
LLGDPRFQKLAYLANTLRLDPMFDPPRNDPRFQKLVALEVATLSRERTNKACPLFVREPFAGNERNCETKREMV